MAGRGAVGTRMEFVMWMKYSAVLHSAGLCKERNTAEKDMIGPPDPVSNIRPIRPRRPKSKAVRLPLAVLCNSPLNCDSGNYLADWIPPAGENKQLEHCVTWTSSKLVEVVARMLPSCIP